MDMNDIFDVKRYLKDNPKSKVMQDSKEVSSYYYNLDTGFGMIAYYHVFEGIEFMYNTFKSDSCEQLNSYFKNEDRIIINHCNKGRFEANINNQVFYLGEGDLSCSYVFPNISSSFPLGYYEGIEILIDTDVAQKSLNDFIGNDINLDVLAKKINRQEKCFVIRSKKEVEHIISELYHVNDSIKTSYLKLKVVEFLLFLLTTDFEGSVECQKHVSKKQAAVVHNIKDYVAGNISENITLDDLSGKFNISKTSIKNNFKIMYGKSLFKWRQEYRLQLASTMLEDTDLPISEISKSIGYKNHSKFSSIFKSYYGCTPSEHRQKQ